MSLVHVQEPTALGGREGGHGGREGGQGGRESREGGRLRVKLRSIEMSEWCCGRIEERREDLV